MAFNPVASSLDMPDLETRTLERWRALDLFGQSLRQRAGAPEWVFYEGPPTANGRPGTHHVWARVFKDLYPRFHTMRGKHVARKGGWDCHGLPVELEVEKELGFSGKAQIETYGIEAFNAKCRDSVKRYVDEFTSLTERIGMWIDTDNAYWTLSPDFVESVWWLFKQMWDAGAIYEGFKVVPYCGRCGTALSSHEVAQGYGDVTEPSVYVRFPVVNADFDLLVWTTTPWTLVSNVAAAVGPHVEYVRARTGHGERDVVIAAGRVEAVLGDDVEIIGTIAVDDLVGRRYERPFDLLAFADPAATAGAHRILAADFVTTDDGSGIVHLAPAFGEIDREICEAAGIGVLNPVDAEGRFDASVPPWTGIFVKDADPLIIEALGEVGKLVATVDYTHSYPHCWRCATPLIYWAKPTWFARTSSYREALLRENAAIGWHPEHIRDGRFGDWLENNVDWALSRDRYWGTPLPVWRCNAGHHHCVGSLAELSELSGVDLTAFDPHRPAVDDITIACPQCPPGAPRARRVEPVLDAWFDSGSVPTAQDHYPFENEAQFDERFPADFICEAIDQTRGWFYSLLAVNTLVFGRSPYRNVVCLAHIVDQDGQKMSKSKGNVIDPWELLDSRGADALRWYFFSAGSPWTPRRIFEEGIDESTRRFLLTLWNTYSFFVTYANLDGWSPDHNVGDSTHVNDRWIRSRLHHTIGVVTDSLEGFDALSASQALTEFVDDLSNWYVRRSRARFWKASDTSAHATLHECLVEVVKLLAPMCPFISDEIYRNLTGEVSVHLADWPNSDADAIDEKLVAEMADARQIVSLGRSARTSAKIRVRQPLHRALVVLPGAAALGPDVTAEIADELNVKAVDVITDITGLLTYTVVPNFRTLGPRAGQQMPALKEALRVLDGAVLQASFDGTGTYAIALEGSPFVLEPGDVEIRAQSHEELALAQEDGFAVALDTTIDDALRREGLARELVRALNDHRKAIGLEIADRIRVEVFAEGLLGTTLVEHGDWIASETLTIEWIVRTEAPVDATTVMLDEQQVAFTLQPST